MNDPIHLLAWCRNWHRSVKFAVLLIAAWAPLLFPESPLLTGVVMAVTTALFFVVTGPRIADRGTESPIPHENSDAGS